MKKQNKKPKKQSKKLLIEQILDEGDKAEIRSLFAFDNKTPKEEILFKFRLWSRWFFSNYFFNKQDQVVRDASFHNDFDENNLRVYRGEQDHFINAGFRGCSKTTRNKLFLAFCIANDDSHYRKFIKILASDGGNAKQITTDIYNMFISERVSYYYSELFQKSTKKREETMSAFTTSTGVRVSAGTVGMEQRGDVQEESRPDFIVFTDFETRKTLRSAVLTQAIWDNMEEARTGLSKGGGSIYECNYLSERGNVHRLIKNRQHVLITPIIKDGEPTWKEQYDIADIEQIKLVADDFEGEYLGEPSAGLDVMFDRSVLSKQERREPVKELSGFKMFYEFNPSHRYGAAADVGGGVGLDHSTTVFIDFTQNPNRVVATFKSNTIKPDIFGDEIQRQCELYGNPIIAPEANNHGHATIGRLKQIYDNIFIKEASPLKKNPVTLRDYGWLTTAANKPKIIFDLKKAIENGHLELSDPDLIAEVESYTRDDLMDREEDPRLTTRHHDLFMACIIALQMRTYADKAEAEERYERRLLEQERRKRAISIEGDYL
jgi:hypothetical protein